MKDYNVMIDGRNFFDQLIKNLIRTYGTIRKIAAGHGDDYTTGCLLDYSCFKEHHKMIAIDISKQQAFDDDPKAIQQINFTRNLEQDGNTLMFLIREEPNKTILDFSQGTVRVLRIYFAFIEY